MNLRQTIKKDIFFIEIVLLIICAGTAGYMVVEGWNFLDSLYMTVITLSTVGYREVVPLTEDGKVFTIFLILGGVGAAAIILSRITADLFDAQLSFYRRRQKMLDRIAKLQDHCIFCGYGRLAQIAVQELDNHNRPVVVIENNDARIAEIEELGVYHIQGDATQDDILRQAGVARADQLVSLLPKDADNLYVILAAKELNPDLSTVTRAEYPVGEKRLIRAGADKVISPYYVGGQRIADGLLRPHVVDFLDLASSTSKADLILEELRIPSGSPLHGRAIRDTELKTRTNAIVAAVVSPEGKTLFNPPDSTPLEQGSVLIGLGTRQDLKALESLLLPESEKR